MRTALYFKNIFFFKLYLLFTRHEIQPSVGCYPCLLLRLIAQIKPDCVQIIWRKRQIYSFKNSLLQMVLNFHLWFLAKIPETHPFLGKFYALFWAYFFDVLVFQECPFVLHCHLLLKIGSKQVMARILIFPVPRLEIHKPGYQMIPATWGTFWCHLSHPGISSSPLKEELNWELVSVW